jgi:hypothetical protein
MVVRHLLALLGVAGSVGVAGAALPSPTAASAQRLALEARVAEARKQLADAPQPQDAPATVAQGNNWNNWPNFNNWANWANG